MRITCISHEGKNVNHAFILGNARALRTRYIEDSVASISQAPRCSVANEFHPKIAEPNDNFFSTAKSKNFKGKERDGEGGFIGAYPPRDASKLVQASNKRIGPADKLGYTEAAYMRTHAIPPIIAFSMAKSSRTARGLAIVELAVC